MGSVRWRRAQRRQPRDLDRPAEPTAVPVAIERPSDLSTQTAAVWDALAPHAIAATTLTPASVWAFRDLCEAVVLKRAMLARISREGLVVDDAAHPLLSRHTALMVRVETLLARFRLMPMGKEMPTVAQPVDEFAEFDRDFGLIQGGKT